MTTSGSPPTIPPFLPAHWVAAEAEAIGGALVRRLQTGGIVIVLVSCGAVASAQVTVWPQQSKPGTTERYTVRVPTEGVAPTASVELEIPPDVTVTGLLAPTGYTYEVVREGARVTRITWRQEIKAGEIGEFVFFARNPKTAEAISWRAHQRFTNGAVNDWIGQAGARRPAAIVKLAP
jgi:uncharacterized protein YcnI